jgi:hypothetical protein
MTIAQKIKSRVDKLAPTQQRSVLKFLDTLQMPHSGKGYRQRKMTVSEIRSAVRGIAGMWKDRTDLPKDPVEAVKALRAKMWSRGRNA